MTRKVLLCSATGVLAVALACGRSAPAPTSPSATTQPEAGAAADGSTLKSTTPSIVSPAGGTQVTDPVTLTSSKAAGKFIDLPLSYQFQIRSGSTVVYDSGVTGGVGSGDNVSHTVTTSAALNPDSDYTWRVRAAYQGAVGSWSADGVFKSPVGAFIRGNEVRDPLTIGRTVGEIRGPVQFIPGVGLKLIGHDSHVLYRLPQNLQTGEISMLILGADEGTEGDKSKVFAMQEGPDEGDITDDDYRMTAELRGRNYSSPGAVTARIIPGDGQPRDFPRVQLNFDSTRWYFWRFSWQPGRARLEVRRDSETGSAVYDNTIGVGSHPYRPDPHYLYLGSPVGRAGPIDATLPGGTYKNVYIGPNTRPSFPQ
ncbi:MAG: hypothetical protein ABIQ52_14805 [Vicinamibacterales bacterium]